MFLIFFNRLNELNDDRSFVILATNVLEYQIDRFLKVFIPAYKELITEHTNLSTKINIIKAFELIPKQFGNMCDIIKNIRNEFGHNFEIDSFNDADKSKKLQKNIEALKSKWKEFEKDMCYWKEGEPLIFMFKDIWRVTFEGLRVYECNVKLFRQETEKKEFINNLKNISIDLESQKNIEERARVIKKLWRGQ